MYHILLTIEVNEKRIQENAKTAVLCVPYCCIRPSQPEAVFFCWKWTAQIGTPTPMLNAVNTPRVTFNFWCDILSKLYMCLACM